MKKIGIFGGTFDPVHFGHINLALSLFEAHQLDEIWWIPAQKNPLKVDLPTSDSHRLEMLRLATHGLSFCKISEMELMQKEPSYTIDTIKNLKKQFPKDQFFLLLGDDAVPHFMKWKNPLELLVLSPPLIGSRITQEMPLFPKEVALAFQKGWTKIPLLEISATDIRERLRNHLFCGHLLPAKVLDYIARNGLYFSS